MPDWGWLIMMIVYGESRYWRGRRRGRSEDSLQLPDGSQRD